MRPGAERPRWGRAERPEKVGVEGQELLSTGTGALLVLVAIWMLTEMGHRKVRGR